MEAQTLVNNPNLSVKDNVVFNNMLEKIRDFFDNKYKGPYLGIQLLASFINEMKIVCDPCINAPLINFNMMKKEVLINPSKLSEYNVDHAYLLAVHFLTLLNDNKDIEPLILGQAASIVQHSIVPTENPYYENERKLTNLLSSLISDDVMLKLCFNNDMQALNEALIERGISFEEIKDIIRQLRYINENRRENNNERMTSEEDLCNQMQLTIIGIFTKSAHTNEEISTFYSRLNGKVATDYFIKLQQLGKIAVVEPQTTKER